MTDDANNPVRQPKAPATAPVASTLTASDGEATGGPKATAEETLREEAATVVGRDDESSAGMVDGPDAGLETSVDGPVPAQAHDAGANDDSATDASGSPSPDGGPTSASDLSAIKAKLQSLEELTRETRRLEERHIGIIERLHSDNARLRQGELAQALRPLFLDLARLHDDVANFISSAGPELGKAKIIPTLIVDVLERHGVSELIPTVGEGFDPKRHQPVEVIVTDELTLDGAIASVRRSGFARAGEHIVRPAQVDVFRFKPPEASEISAEHAQPPATDLDPITTKTPSAPAESSPNLTESE